MKLPKELTTVTPASKFLAVILFVTIPFLAFLYGMKYQEFLDFNRHPKDSVSSRKVKRVPTPTPDFSKTAINLVRNQKEVQEWLGLFTEQYGTNPVTGGKPVIDIDHKEVNDFLIHVYEKVSDSFYPHNATFNWYRVNEKTWEVTKE